jgi:hypothetical protein
MRASDRHGRSKDSKDSKELKELAEFDTQINMQEKAVEDQTHNNIRDKENRMVHQKLIPEKKKRKELEWALLPTGITDNIVLFVGSPDMCAHIRMTSTVWRNWVSEFASQHICRRIYLAQTKRDKLKIENWRTWHNMLVNKPRIRLNGLYSLRTLFSKASSNDRFWEERNSQSIEYYYYRHIRFLSNGQLLYAHNTVHPEDIIPALSSEAPVYKKVTVGDYLVRGSLIYIKV